MSIFSYLDYREFVSIKLKELKKNRPGFSQALFARKSEIPNTYLTNVLKGRGNFNSDQIFAIARELDLNPLESDYLALLKEFDQCSSPDRKLHLKQEIESRRAQAHKTEAFISAKVRKNEHELIVKYYSDPLIKIVHVLLQIPKYQKKVEKIAEDMLLPSSYVDGILKTLQELELIRFVDKHVEVLHRNFHLSKDSAMLLPHQSLMRARSVQRLQQVPQDQRYSFSVTCTGTEKTRELIQQKFLAFLKEIESEVKTALPENAYQMNFDLFPWNEPR
ncbi:MAG: TIGR02147 family protein [Bdellovibrionales bacterium]|nr:TIGR02147 family protein [Bdellovibrionales bacterium]